MGCSGSGLLTLSSSHFDPQETSGFACGMLAEDQPGPRQHFSLLLRALLNKSWEIVVPWPNASKEVVSAAKMVASPKGKYADFRIIGVEAAEQK